MKKRILSLVLMLVMALSVVACGSKASVANSSKNALESMAAIKSNSFEYEALISVDEEQIAAKIYGGIYDAQNAVINIDVKGNIPDLDAKFDEYMHLTDIMLVNGNEYYVNVTSVFDFLTEIEPSMAMYQSYLNLSGDYFKVNAKELADLLTQLGEYSDEYDVEFTEEEFTFTELDKTVEVDKELLNILVKFIDEFAEKAGNDAVVFSADTIKFTMTNDNFTAIVDALAAMDVEDYCMKIAERIDQMDKTLGNTAFVKEELEGLNQNLKDAVEELKAESTDLGKFNAVFEMGVKNKNIVMNMNVEAETDDMTPNITFNYKFSQDKVKSFEVPSSTFGVKDVYAAIGSLLGGLD